MAHVKVEEFEAIVRLEGGKFWRQFIRYFEERGIDRDKLSEAVARFRTAQDNLADVVADGGYLILDKDQQ